MSGWEARCKCLHGAAVSNGDGYSDDYHADQKQGDLRPVRIGNGKKTTRHSVDDDDGACEHQRVRVIPAQQRAENRSSCGELTGSVTDVSENGGDGRDDSRPTVVARFDEVWVGQQIVFNTLAFHADREKEAE